ncbi:MAG: hypothetical protein CMJ20_00960 [Phycisphaeraceae bacterium]|nr:hypothetical protein [Phycisphaeraceae bacterium]|tara:strand:- start:115 stop:1527 length:1413 start_codon:yes stop_codon:yes gene_type:complete
MICITWSNGNCCKAVMGLVLLVWAVGCQKDTAPSPPPVLLVSIDGLEWDVMLPLLRDGKMSNTAKLMERGNYGLLETFEPTLSPVIWTSIATGKNPGKHGISNFAKHQPGKPAQLFSNSDRKTKAIWNIASDYGKRVAICGWWMTFPVEPVNGVMVAQTNTIQQIHIAKGENIWKGQLIEGIPGQVYPYHRQNEMMNILWEVERSLSELTGQIFGQFSHPLSMLGERLWNNCLWCFRADATYLRITETLLDDPEPYNLTAVYFSGPDVVGHRFWRYMQPDLYDHKPTPEQVENFGMVIENYYRYMDQAIGALVARMGDQARILIVSDHGMQPINQLARFDPDDPPNDVNSAHHRNAPPGVIIAAGPGFRESNGSLSIAKLKRADLVTTATVMDITPTLLALMKLPIGEDMDGQVADNLLDPDQLHVGQRQIVGTHDTPQWVETHQALVAEDPGQDERLEQLRSLGYIGND